MNIIKKTSVVFILLFAYQNLYADEFNIKISSPPTTSSVSLNIELLFERPTIIYHWLSEKTIYPILNRGLYVECYELDSGDKVLFMPLQKILPKLPHKLDTLATLKYVEELKIIPGQNYTISKLKRGKYSLKLIYDTRRLKKYSGGEALSLVRIESNEIMLEIM